MNPARTLLQHSRRLMASVWITFLIRMAIVRSVRNGVTAVCDVMWITNTKALFRLSPRSDLERIPWSRFGHEAYALQGGVWLWFTNGVSTCFQDDQVRASYAIAGGPC